MMNQIWNMEQNRTSTTDNIGLLGITISSLYLDFGPNSVVIRSRKYFEVERPPARQQYLQFRCIAFFFKSVFTWSTVGSITWSNIIRQIEMWIFNVSSSSLTLPLLSASSYWLWRIVWLTKVDWRESHKEPTCLHQKRTFPRRTPRHRAPLHLHS